MHRPRGRSAHRCSRLIAALSVLAIAACGGGSSGNVTGPSPPSPPGQAFGPADPALVGTWNGTLEGSFGPGVFSMTLVADGTIQTSGSGNYCGFRGTWGVSAGQFATSGPDCSGTIVTLSAPASSTAMSGVWSASSGRSGTFACTKQ